MQEDVRGRAVGVHPAGSRAVSSVGSAAGSAVGNAAGNARAGARRPISAPAMQAWRAFLGAHAKINRRLEAELEAEQSMPLASYDVLVQLAEAPQRSLRMSELADSVLLSRSGLTRLVDRLERDLLVERQACLDDARGTLAVLTPAGLERLRVASGTHLRGVAEHWVARFSDDELATLASLLDRVNR